MIIIKSLFFILLSLDMDPERERWVTLPLAESYEYQILNGKGVWTAEQYRKFFLDHGFTIQHWEIKREFERFKNLDELKEWIRTRIASEYDAQEDESFMEQYLKKIEASGWVEFEDHSFGFPRQQLLVLLAKEKG